MKFNRNIITFITALSLSGCGALDNINSTTHKADIDYNRGQSTMDKMSHGDPVVEIKSQWINPVPISKETKSQMPGCAVTFTRPGKVTINEVLAFIGKTCHIPGSVTPDAMAAISAAGAGGDTTQINGKVPLPSASTSGSSGSMPSLASMGGAAVGVSDNSLHGVFWTGDAKGLLDNVTTREGVSWRFQGGRIQVYYLDTKNFPVLFMDNQTEYSAIVVSGTTSSNGQSGGDSSSSGGLTGDTDTEQSTKTGLKTSLYADLEKTVKTMLTPGVGREYLSSGVLTVTDTPQTLQNISEYIKDRNKELNRQVVLNVEVLSVTKHNEDQVGIDWDLVFNSESISGSVANTFANASTDAMSSGVTILDGKFAGSSAFLHALSEQANVSVVTQEATTTTNMSAVPIQVGTQQDYADNVQNDDTANVGSSTSISKSTVTTGFNMTVLPYILPSSDQIQLLAALSMSDEPTFRDFSSGESTIQLMKTKLKVINQRAMLHTGQTLVLSGFQQMNDTGSKQGVGSASFWGFGGGGDATNDKTMLLILITPTLVGS